MKIEPNSPPPPNAPEPARKFYALKPSENFERANVPVAEAADAPTDVRHHLRIAASDRRTTAVNAPAASRNDVHDLLAVNLARETALGLNRVGSKPKRTSRRKLDYWICVIGLNLLVAAIIALEGPNPANLIFGLAAIVLGTVTLTWVMWFIMEDY